MSGYKTYLVAIAIGVLTTLRYLDYLTQQQFEVFLGLLNGAGLAALRAGVTKSGVQK